MKFNHTAHKELWNWLAENPDKGKEDWPGWNINGGEYKVAFSYCFACDSADGCHVCPIVWGNTKWSRCGDTNSLWNRWNFTYKLAERSEIARQIANLSVREGVECE